MFESAEPGQEIDKATYDKDVAPLRAHLLDAQLDMGELEESVRLDDSAPINRVFHAIPTSGDNPPRGGGSGVK